VLADDNLGIRECCREQLEGEGYRVVLACDGGEAIRLVRTQRPDVLVLDVHMPRLGGLDALERVQANFPRLPVILFTTNPEDCLADHRRGLAAACVSKCEDLAELKQAIARVLKPGQGHAPVPTSLFSLEAASRPRRT
jgi:CheY-like chemotaxis protein